MQIAGGLFANSLGLLSDAAHNASDVVALLVSYLALRLLLLPATPRRTFAFKRAEVLAALANAAALLVVSGWVVYAAILRMGSPPEVLGVWVALFAGLGMAANSASALLLRGYRDLNTRAAYLHLVADAAFSFGVLVSGGLIALTGWYVLDPVVSIVLAAWMIYESALILRSSLHILMEATPEGLDYEEVRQALTAHPLVKGVHDLHIWALSSTEFALSAHVEVEEPDLEKLGGLTGRLRARLAEEFAITHATFEVELVGAACGHDPCVVIGI
jgi:cobalt-zinc-cadmium efflux system protein